MTRYTRTGTDERGEMDEAGNIVERLKPCPFCGTMPQVRNSGTVDGDYVVCRSRKCSVQPCSNSGAIAAWNRRAPVEQKGEGSSE